MKRSEIQESIEWAKNLLSECRFKLPEMAYWDMNKWQENKARIGTIKETMLGWDITDFGMGDFRSIGAVLYTIRNGSCTDSSIGTPYAEKIIALRDGQRLPMHCHYSKSEDIINRGGGTMFIKLYGSAPGGGPDFESDVEVYRDGIKHTYKAGEEILITTGCSITLTPGLYHTFGAKAGEGDLFVGEVSSVNDDNADNNFYEEVSRFASIEEDTAVTVPLCNEYDKLFGEE